MGIIQTKEEVAEAIKDNPEYWAEIIIQLSSQIDYYELVLEKMNKRLSDAESKLNYINRSRGYVVKLDS
jgi:hypothetical protein